MDNLLETVVVIVGGGMEGLFAARKAKEAGATLTLADQNYVGRTRDF